MHLIRTHINGNPNVGLYGYATNKFCLLGREVPEEVEKQIKEALQVPVWRLTIAGTSLIGVFVSGNSKGIIIPSITFPEEAERIKEITTELGIGMKTVDAKLTALGNNVLCNDNGCIINPELEMEGLSEFFGVEVKKGKIASLPTVGSVAALNTKGCALHRDAEQFEIDFVSESLSIECETSTVNMGNAFLRSGIIVNDYGLVVGSTSGGPEVNHLDHIFGFLDD